MHLIDLKTFRYLIGLLATIIYNTLFLRNLQIEKIQMQPTIKRIATSEFQLGFILAELENFNGFLFISTERVKVNPLL